MSINGTAADDLLIGTDLQDVIDGLAGSDRLEGRDGNDVLNGGDGDDRNFRNLIDSNGVIHPAQIAGLFGGAGNDTLSGEAGNDFLSPEEGNYVVDGGTEFDVLGLDYSASSTAISVVYTNPAGTTANGNTIRNVEAVAVNGGSSDDLINVTATSGGPFNVEGNLIFAGAGNDTIRSGSGRDRLLGGDGDDVINGGAGDDRSFNNYATVIGTTASAQIAGLFGGAGKDTLRGEAGNDFLSPEEGNYVVDGGTEFDVLGLDYSASSTAISVVYTNPAGTTANGNTIRNVEAVAVNGGSSDDLINVTATSGGPFNVEGNLIFAGAGNDTIRSGSGRDRLLGGDGDDVINGGAGDDRSFNNYATVIGTTASAQIAGLFGGAGNDTLNGEAGNDFLNPEEGNYVVDGGTEFDVLGLDYSASLSAVSVTYTNANGTTANGNTIRNVEAVAVNGGGNDDVINVTATSGGPFNVEGNLIFAGAGNDTVRSGSGRDRLLGGDGDDVINGGAGDDRGFNNYATVIGTTASAQIAGLFGGAGKDTLRGEAGDDFLEGGTGRDTLTGGLGADRFTFNASTEGIDRITDFNISETDVIAVSAGGFGGGLTAGAPITADQFVLGTTAGDANDRFIYDSATGALRFDRDGTGVNAAVQIATLSSKPTLSNANILVVA